MESSQHSLIFHFNKSVVFGASSQKAALPKLSNIQFEGNSFTTYGSHDKWDINL